MMMMMMLGIQLSSMVLGFSGHFLSVSNDTCFWFLVHEICIILLEYHTIIIIII